MLVVFQQIVAFQKSYHWQKRGLLIYLLQVLVTLNWRKDC